MTVDSIIVPAHSVSEFTVKGTSTLFRITVKATRGGEIRGPKVTGPAKLLQTTDLIEVVEDGLPEIGFMIREFLFQGTTSGKVKIEFTTIDSVYPTPIALEYEVTIE